MLSCAAAAVGATLLFKAGGGSELSGIADLAHRGVVRPPFDAPWERSVAAAIARDFPDFRLMDLEATDWRDGKPIEVFGDLDQGPSGLRLEVLMTGSEATSWKVVYDDIFTVESSIPDKPALYSRLASDFPDVIFSGGEASAGHFPDSTFWSVEVGYYRRMDDGSLARKPTYARYDWDRSWGGWRRQIDPATGRPSGEPTPSPAGSEPY